MSKALYGPTLPVIVISVMMMMMMMSLSVSAQPTVNDEGDFLLVIIVTLALSRTVSEIWPVIGSKSQNFHTPLSFRALAWAPYGIFGKALQILKLESLGQPMVKI